MTRENPKPPFVLLESDAPHLLDLPVRMVNMLKSAHAGNGYDAIAAEYTVPVGTVKSRIHRARERILKKRAEARQAAEPMQAPTMGPA